MRFALLLFILVPIVEISLLIQVGSKIGSLQTIGLVFLTAIVGVTVLRKQGIETAQKAQGKIQRGEMPATEVAEGLMLIFAGLCLLIPGFATDIIGGLLLVPFLRRLLAAGLIIKFMSSMMTRGFQWGGQQSNGSSQEGDIIEGEYENDDNDLIGKK